jgi:predicted DNA-binding ribbon-helix-helix protein
MKQSGTAMKSWISKRSIVIAGHKTSISLEDAFWQTLRKIASERGVTMSSLVGEIDQSREQSNLSSALRLFVLERVRASALNAAAQASGNLHKDSGAARGSC